MHRAANILHGIINGQTGGHNASRRVYIHLYRLRRIFTLAIKQLRSSNTSHVVIHLEQESLLKHCAKSDALTGPLTKMMRSFRSRE